ncbi:MAG: metallophosphoesterase [Flavobacteriaceae bacterium]|nr:metallophosphoesterase [Flavobacteriaceae bacterium]
MINWILLIIFFCFFEFYAFQGLKTISNNKTVNFLFTFLVFLIMVNMAYQIIVFDREVVFTHYLSYSIGLFIALFIFQLTIVSALFIEDIKRFFQLVFRYFIDTENEKLFPQRRKFISQIAFLIGAIPFTGLVYGMIHGKYNYKVLNYSLKFDDLPEEFDGFTITQISDIHCGSLDNKEKVKYGIDLINKQKSDVILFTGDLVNNKSEEAFLWIDIFKELKAPYGKFSILGNHDYGDYAYWDSDKEKNENMNLFKEIQKKIGFNLLLNESKYVRKGNAKIAIVGVENWGRSFKKAGDLDKAVSKINKNDFKILLTHDPTHWEAKVLDHKFGFPLTLSGHTHGMQFGIEIPGIIKWSPIKWSYKQWAGIYNKRNKYLNVNRGFGYLAYPGRVGIYPEISVIKLRSS